MSNVERFESVMAERLGPHAIIKVEGEYVQPAMRLALIAWQSSRRAALENGDGRDALEGVAQYFEDSGDPEGAAMIRKYAVLSQKAGEQQ